ncbi:MAG: insulinase family protein [Anaeromicrobium sp.]|jgi:predicted Zn-dependent peptidase|uniref:M16 family metallopeptidase n=1 Tax=Anaeromicrobium sp. TaxID=1929132 RepID=UPI0025DE3F22|nr:pitrilysin family protein [Anaeromicrobium sp.]MCT4595845.1 insulinase family protein [Anaeromicrobium sp.]
MKSYFDYKEQVLPNGLNLITVKKNTNFASIQIGLKVGALYETLEEKGLSHLIEHMLFKGTYTRTNHNINDDLEERAGSYDAYTNYSSTVLGITALQDEFENSMELLSDMIIHSTFPSDELEKEKKVIVSEIKSSLDDVEEYSFRKINSIAFKDHPLRYDVLGTKRNVNGFSREDIIRFYNKYYVPNNCVVSIVSPYSHEEAKAMVEKYFGLWKKGNSIKAPLFTEKNKPIQKMSYKDNISQNTLIFLYTFHGLTRREELVLETLNYKLGESANSILFKCLREDKGFSYDVYSEVDSTNSIKTLCIYTTASDSDIEDAQKVIEESINDIKNGTIVFDEKTINHMKKLVKTSLLSLVEDCGGLSHFLLSQRIMDQSIESFEEELKILDEITKEEFLHVANKVFNDPTIHTLMSE